MLSRSAITANGVGPRRWDRIFPVFFPAAPFESGEFNSFSTLVGLWVGASDQKGEAGLAARPCCPFARETFHRDNVRGARVNWDWGAATKQRPKVDYYLIEQALQQVQPTRTASVIGGLQNASEPLSIGRISSNHANAIFFPVSTIWGTKEERPLPTVPRTDDYNAWHSQFKPVE